jgi:hypothetical protein
MVLSCIVLPRAHSVDPTLRATVYPSLVTFVDPSLVFTVDPVLGPTFRS